MFPNPAIKASKVVAEPTLGTPVHHDTDQILADNHRDMRIQAKHPSALRKRYDHSAVDDHQRLPLSQLTEYLLTADSLKASGASQAHRAALECLSRTVTSAYERSPCFRRLFNQAWVARLHDPQARSCLAIGNGEPQSEGPTLSLPDVLKRGPKPKYETAAGPSSLSDKRAVLNSTIKMLTQLPDTEPGHPRGPNTEYVNIILKEMRALDSAQISSHTASEPLPTKPKGPAAAALNRVMLQLGRSGGAPGPGDAMRKNAKAHLKEWAKARLLIIEARGAPANNYLAAMTSKEIRALNALPELLMRFFQNVRGNETALELLKQLASQNVRRKLFTYDISKFREPVAMVIERGGDCRSFCSLYLLLAQAAQIPKVSQLNLDGEMDMPLPTIDPRAAEPTEVASVRMANHSILKIGDGAHCCYFDPVFGQQVDPAFYGKDQNRYFLENAQTHTRSGLDD